MTAQVVTGELAPKVLQALDEMLSEYCGSDTPGLVVGLRQHGHVLLQHAQGMACVAAGTALTSKTRMRIGSTTKQFCCWALLLLVDEGRLALDDDVRILLPELPNAQGAMTLRQLMQHTSGLRCHMDLWTIATAMRSALPDEELLALLMRQRGTNFSVGQRLMYSNGGYLLLSETVQRASGQSLGEFLQNRVFAPLGMHDTWLLSHGGSLLPGLASQHSKLGASSWQRVQMPIALSGEGGLVSSLDDMLRWLAHLDTPAAQPLYERLQERATLPSVQGPALADYGLGLCLRSYRGQRLVGHAGAVLGGQAEVIKLPDACLDLVVIVNRGDISAPELARRVIDIVLSDQLEPARQSALEQVRALAGRYRARSDGQVLQLLCQSDQGLLDFGGVKAPLWVDDDASSLVFAGALGELRLRPIDTGLELRENGRTDLLDHLPEGWAQHPAAAHWQTQLLGRYFSEELPAEAIIFVRDGVLQLGLQGRFGRAVYRLQALAPGLWSAHEASGAMAYSFTLEFCSDGQAQPPESAPLTPISALRLNSLRTRRLEFQRVVGLPASGLLSDWTDS